MKKSFSAFYINLDFDSYPEAIRSLVQASMGSDFKAFHSIISPYRDLTVKTTGGSSSSVSLRFKNKGNSLKQLMESMDEILAEEIARGNRL
jgi:hypothetical protein